MSACSPIGDTAGMNQGELGAKCTPFNGPQEENKLNNDFKLRREVLTNLSLVEKTQENEDRPFVTTLTDELKTEQIILDISKSSSPSLFEKSTLKINGKTITLNDTEEYTIKSTACDSQVLTASINNEDFGNGVLKLTYKKLNPQTLQMTRSEVFSSFTKSETTIKRWANSVTNMPKRETINADIISFLLEKNKVHSLDAAITEPINAAVEQAKLDAQAMTKATNSYHAPMASLTVNLLKILMSNVNSEVQFITEINTPDEINTSDLSDPEALREDTELSENSQNDQNQTDADGPQNSQSDIAPSDDLNENPQDEQVKKPADASQNDPAKELTVESNIKSEEADKGNDEQGPESTTEGDAPQKMIFYFDPQSDADINSESPFKLTQTDDLAPEEEKEQTLPEASKSETAEGDNTSIKQDDDSKNEDELNSKPAENTTSAEVYIDSIKENFDYSKDWIAKNWFGVKEKSTVQEEDSQTTIVDDSKTTTQVDDINYTTDKASTDHWLGYGKDYIKYLKETSVEQGAKDVSDYYGSMFQSLKEYASEKSEGFISSPEL